MSVVSKIYVEISALAGLFFRALFISPFNRRDTALLNLLIIAKKGREFNLHALLEYDHVMKEELAKLRSRMSDRTHNFQEELQSAQKRLQELEALARGEDVGPEDLIRMKSEMEIELKHLRSEWSKWKNLIEDELHSQRDIGGKIKQAWYALTPRDPETYSDATEVVQAVIHEREKLKEGWQQLKQEQDAFFEKCKENNDKHLEIDRAWKAISYAQKSIKDERDSLRQSWLRLKNEQEDIVTRFQSVEKDYQKIDNAWKEISYTHKTVSKAGQEIQALESKAPSSELQVPKSTDLSLALQKENLKRDYYEKQAGKYIGDISAHFKEHKKTELSQALDVNAVLEQILDITLKSKMILTGEHPFKLPKRDGKGQIHAFYYQKNIYEFWRWLQEITELEVVVIGTDGEDQLWERTLDFLSGKGAHIAHFPHNVSLIKRKQA